MIYSGLAVEFILRLIITKTIISLMQKKKLDQFIPNFKLWNAALSCYAASGTTSPYIEIKWKQLVHFKLEISRSVTILFNSLKGFIF